ncbi:hypothetical protein BPORC_1848 [Bifidobacterium porcinum]|nr:hypothetical protein BPORC_1848 [Bifidobacterium porcinum]
MCEDWLAEWRFGRVVWLVWWCRVAVVRGLARRVAVGVAGIGLLGGLEGHCVRIGSHGDRLGGCVWLDCWS